jgi:MFS transporter, MHS family, alpha-ketoglutarate permease
VAIVKSAFGADRALTATWINLLGLIFLMLLQPVGGLISDRVGRKVLLVFFGVGLGYALANSVFDGTAPLLFQAAKSGHHIGWFIFYVTAVIAVSLLVYVFGLKNKGITALDREQGSALAVPGRSRRPGRRA